MCYDVTALDLRILEDRVTIAIATFLNGEIDELLLNGVIAVHPMDHILHLDAISPDILDSRCTHLARNI